MRAVSCKETKLEVVELPEPIPGKGQLVIDVLRCGICGSDLHARHHSDELADVMDEMGIAGTMRPSHSVVFGHEFCGEVVEHGAGTKKKALPAGSRVVALPLVRGAGKVEPVGFTTSAPGAYAERMVIEAALAEPVPNGLPTELATLTEPMAVGLHAVRRSEIKRREVAIVIGAGPVGLAVICMLKASGVRTVIASDFSAGRRALAGRCGADIVVDPGHDSPFTAPRQEFTDAPKALGQAIDTMEKLRKLPLPWQHVWRAAEALGAMPKGPVVFECVGVPGVIESIVTGAPPWSRIVVVGVCMGSDRFRPSMALNKELELRFVLGYTPREFRETLHMLAEGEVTAAPMITGTVGLAGVDNAFSALADPETHAKILIDPRCETLEPTG